MPNAKPETIKAGELVSLLRKQEYRCAYSGRELTPETASIDHTLPISRGGPNDIGNIAIVHMDVNTAKSSMTLAEFVALCREVVAWADAGADAGLMPVSPACPIPEQAS
jgi:5-methylcytosine-specific restriction endonuclease McrA